MSYPIKNATYTFLKHSLHVMRSILYSDRVVLKSNISKVIGFFFSERYSNIHVFRSEFLLILYLSNVGLLFLLHIIHIFTCCVFFGIFSSHVKITNFMIFSHLLSIFCFFVLCKEYSINTRKENKLPFSQFFGILI